MTTNQILKKVIGNFTSSGKMRFIDILSVDIQNVHPIDFTNMKFTKQNKNDLFLFLDNNHKLVGICEGKTYLKQDCQFIHHEYTHDKHYNPIPMNWKYFKERASLILMLQKKDRTYVRKIQKKYTPKELYQFYQNDLYKRLKKYKLNKYKNMSHGECLEMIEKVYTFFISKLFNNSQEKKRIVKIFSISGSEYIEDCIRYFCEYSKEFQESYDRLCNTIKYNNMDLGYNASNYEEAKLKILNWYNMCKKLENEFS